MKTVPFIVSSGTGNTLLAAKMIQKQFTAAGIRAGIWDITRRGPFNPAGYDLIGPGYPVYAFNTPLFFLRCVKGLSPSCKKFFIFKTSGEPVFPNNVSFFTLIKALKGCAILGDYHFLMPFNIVLRFPDGLVKQVYRYAKKHSALLVSNIATGNSNEKTWGFFRLHLKYFKKPDCLFAEMNHEANR